MSYKMFYLKSKTKQRAQSDWKGTKHEHWMSKDTYSHMYLHTHVLTHMDMCTHLYVTLTHTHAHSRTRIIFSAGPSLIIRIRPIRLSTTGLYLCWNIKLATSILSSQAPLRHTNWVKKKSPWIYFILFLFIRDLTWLCSRFGFLRMWIFGAAPSYIWPFASWVFLRTSFLSTHAN